MMRLVAVHLLLLAGLAVHLCLGGVQADNHISLYRGDSPKITADGERWSTEDSPTNIIGRDNLCVEAVSYDDGYNLQLWPCGNAQPNQLWTFESNGTIRSNGKCMTMSLIYGMVFIYDCDRAWHPDTLWTYVDLGSIRNPLSRLVLTANASTPGTILKVDVDINSSSQAWTRVNYTTPPICQIKDFRGKCLQTNSPFVELADCVPDESQKWSLYYDRTIRSFTNSSLCVTSDGQNIGDLIVLLTCQGIVNERWNFTGNGTILNPNATLVMEVKEEGPLPIIILDKPTGYDNQTWSLFNCE